MKKLFVIITILVAMLALTVSVAQANSSLQVDSNRIEVRRLKLHNPNAGVCTKIQSGELFRSDSNLITTKSVW
jgi:hypothetical protein